MMVEIILLNKSDIQKKPTAYNVVVWGEWNQMDKSISHFLL